jgi:starvation-inducible outer membrane lipoprotein
MRVLSMTMAAMTAVALIRTAVFMLSVACSRHHKSNKGKPSTSRKMTRTPSPRLSSSVTSLVVRPSTFFSLTMSQPLIDEPSNGRLLASDKGLASAHYHRHCLYAAFSVRASSARM